MEVKTSVAEWIASPISEAAPDRTPAIPFPTTRKRLKNIEIIVHFPDSTIVIRE